MLNINSNVGCSGSSLSNHFLGGTKELKSNPNWPEPRITVKKASVLKEHPDTRDLGFGKYFTDHIFQAEYDPQNKWHGARTVPYDELELDPGAAVLHYGQSMFEGLKAFYTRDGRVQFFRPEFHARRMKQGADRLCMVAPPEELFLESIRSVVRQDIEWVPKERGCSLYIRPTLIGREPFLGVRPSDEYLFYVILSPVGSYYSEGINPVRIWVETEQVRAAPGGVGAAKTSANYVAGLQAAVQAKKKGFAQVLWLDAIERKYVEEVGTMNVFFRLKDEIVTPALTGSILPGCTRDSVIQILKRKKLPIVERAISMDEVFKRHRQGELLEVFGSGTAAVISPVGELSYKGTSIIINDFKMGPLAQELYSEITSIQYGEAPDIYGWTVPL